MVLFYRFAAPCIASGVDLFRLYLVAAFEVLSQTGVVPAIFYFCRGYRDALGLHRLIRCGL